MSIDNIEILPSNDNTDSHFCFLPFPSPKIGSKSIASAYQWYFVTVNLIPGVIENIWEQHANTKFECAWNVRSRLRLAASLSLRAPTLTEEFLECTPIPSIESFLKEIGYNPEEPDEHNHEYEPWEHEAGVEKLSKPYLVEDYGDSEKYLPERNIGLTMWDANNNMWVLTQVGWELYQTNIA